MNKNIHKNNIYVVYNKPGQNIRVDLLLLKLKTINNDNYC